MDASILLTGLRMNQRFRILGLIGIAKTLSDTLQKHEIGEKDGLVSSCLSCKAFTESAELCGKFGSRPPARIIAFGCEHYKDSDTIPF